MERNDGIVYKKGRKMERFLPEGTINTWGMKKMTNCSLNGVNKTKNAAHIDNLLEFVAQYASACLYQDITNKAMSLKSVWKLVWE